MAMGQQKDRQGDLMVSWSEMPRSPGHVFYDRLQLVGDPRERNREQIRADLDSGLISRDAARSVYGFDDP